MNGPTQKQIASIARATRKVCAQNAQGSVVNVWKDYSWSEEPTPDTTGRSGSDGEIERRMTYFRERLTRQQVEALLVSEPRASR
jgi:hypothetical protein